MYYQSNKINLAADKSKTGLLFLLALMLLVVSCPLKRLFAEQGPIAPVQQVAKWSGAGGRSLAQHTKSCCAQKQQGKLFTIEISKQKLPVAQASRDEVLEAGFGIHYFLSSLRKQHQPGNFFSTATLPLFLQHRSLLI